MIGDAGRDARCGVMLFAGMAIFAAGSCFGEWRLRGRVGVPPAVLRVSRSTLWSLWAWLSREARLFGSSKRAQRRRDFQSRLGDVILSKSVHFSEPPRRQARVQLSPTLGASALRAGRLFDVRVVQSGRPNRRAGCPPYPAHDFLFL